MIVRKYIITENYPITTRDISLNYSSSSNKRVFDTEEELLQYANNQYYPNQPMQIALVEGEIYGESWCRQFRDIKEHCGLRKDLQEEINKLRNLEFKHVMKLTEEEINSGM